MFCIEINVRARREIKLCTVAPMGVNDMHTMHVVLKIVHVYVWL